MFRAECALLCLEGPLIELLGLIIAARGLIQGRQIVGGVRA